jgi:ATP-dependent Clp protease ATP-binding subunit ClpA
MDGFREVHGSRQGFVQAAQSLALREGHQQFAPDHLLKVLLDDPEGMSAGLIERAGGRPGDALAAVERALAKRPKVSGGGAGQVYLAPELARVFDTAEKIADKAGDKFVTVERLLLALAMEPPTPAACLKDAGVNPTTLNQAINDIRKGRTADSASAEQSLRCLEALCARPDRAGRRGQDRPRHRPRRGDPPHHPGALPAHQEQSRADRRARRRQDRHRRRPGASASSRAMCPRASRTRSCCASTWAR